MNKFTASIKVAFKMPRVPEPPRRWWSAFSQANKAGGLLLKFDVCFSSVTMKINEICKYSDMM